MRIQYFFLIGTLFSTQVMAVEVSKIDIGGLKPASTLEEIKKITGYPVTVDRLRSGTVYSYYFRRPYELKKWENNKWWKIRLDHKKEIYKILRKYTFSTGIDRQSVTKKILEKYGKPDMQGTCSVDGNLRIRVKATMCWGACEQARCVERSHRGTDVRSDGNGLSFEVTIKTDYLGDDQVELKFFDYQKREANNKWQKQREKFDKKNAAEKLDF